MHKIDSHTNHYNEQELLKKYLSGSLSSDEELIVADLYEQDMEFRDALDGLETMEVEEFSASMSRLSNRLDERISAQSDSSDNVISMTPPKMEVKTIYPMRRFAIAASVAFLILLGGTIYVQQMSSPTSKLVASHFVAKPYPDVITRSGSDDHLSEAEKMAISAYNTDNYKVAAEQFDILFAQHPDIVKYGLYLGLSYMSDNNFEGAVYVLSDLRGRSPEYEADIKWYLGLAYLKEKNKIGAIPLFRQLADDTESYYSESAEEILSKLE